MYELYTIGNCYHCNVKIMYLPSKVPTMPSRELDSKVRHPVCKDCVEKMNKVRVDRGLKPVLYYLDAYAS